MKFHVQQFTKTRRLQLLMSVELWITQQADNDIHKLILSSSCYKVIKISNVPTSIAICSEDQVLK